MVTEIKYPNSEQPMTLNILSEILKYSGTSIAALGGGLAVIMTFIANLATWVAVLGGAIGLVVGILGIVLKVQEIRFKNLQYSEYQREIELEKKQLEEMSQN